MRKFIYKIVLFLSLLIIIFIGCLFTFSKLVESRNFKNYNTESNLLFLRNNQNYDILFMGISHARNFSRYDNQLRVEKILNSKIINIGQGNGACGANEQLFYYEYFINTGNKANTLIYVLSPPLMFSKTLPIASNTFNKETFKLNFLYEYLQFASENKKQRIISYIQSKFQLMWLLSFPSKQHMNEESLDSLDWKKVKDGEDIAYGGKGLNFEAYEKSKKQIENTIILANKNNERVILLIPPALFGKWRGHEYVMRFANELNKKYGAHVLDCSECVKKPELYFDNHHLNSEGVVYFTKKYLHNYLNNINSNDNK